LSWFRRRGTDSNGFDRLLRPHLEALYRLAFRFTGSRDDAEDLVQSLLVKLIPLERRLGEVEMLGPWLARALYHQYLNEARRQRREAAHRVAPSEASAEQLDQLVDETSESPEDSAERLLSQRRLSAAWQLLPPEQRAVIAWHDVEGHALEELATQHGLPIGTLKSRLHRGRARMRQLLHMEPAGGLRCVANQKPDQMPET
jgi:RNA polymerase sigma-70 factor (ECF subfamily)